MAGRALISKLPSLSLAARSTISSPLRRLRPLLAAASPTASAGGIPAHRRFSAAAAATPDYPGSLLNYPPPEGDAPEKEDPAFDSMDFEHWLVILEDQDPSMSRDQLIDSYVKTFAKITGSEEEARKKMYSVSTKHYFAFGVLVEEEVSYKIKNLPGVKWVLPDSYINRETKDYGGEPFIEGQAVPYDPKYHEEWLQNYHTSKKPRRQPPRNDQPRTSPRGNENINFQNRDAPPMSNQGFQSPPQQGDSPPMNSSSNVQNALPMPNQGFQSPPQQRDRPPMNSSSNVQNAPQMPIREFNGVQPNTPARTYLKQTPLPESNYAPTGPAYQGNSQNYQVVNPSPAHQGNGQGYQGGYQQGDGRIHRQDGFRGHQQQAYHSGPNYPPNKPSYQQAVFRGHQQQAYHSGPNYPPNRPSYQQGGQGIGTKISIVIRSFDNPLIENYHFGTRDTRKIGLPESRVLYTVLRSPHIDKKSREQFEMKIKKQFMTIKTEPHELRKKFFWLKRQRIFGSQYEIRLSCKTRLPFPLPISKAGRVLRGPGYQQGDRGVGTQNYQGGQGVGPTNVPGREY